MTSAERPIQSRRGIALIVGRGAKLDDLCHRLDQPVVRVENLMEAIGELTTVQPQGPIRSVIISAEVAKQATGRAIDALRLVDPAVEVLLHGASPDETIASSVLDRFDGRFADPDEEGAEEDKPDDLTSDRPQTVPAAIGHPPPPETPPPPPETPPPPPETPPPPTETPSPPTETPSPPTETPSPPTETQPSPRLPDPPDQVYPDDELGDIDLVEAANDGCESVQQVAIRLIDQQTGWSDLMLVDDPGQADTAAGCAAAMFEQQFFGYLTTTQAVTAEIEPWAAWLACWLALARDHEHYKLWAYTDDLTGAGNRRFFNKFLREAIAQSRDKRRVVTVMVFDIDDFKQYNDRFGHEAGDEILRETVALLTSVIRRGDRVCRIGGDEFAVIFADPEDPREPGSSHPEEIGHIARRFQEQIAGMRFPKLGIEARGPLTISGGLATYPWDGLTPDELLRLADQRTLQSKRRGKNLITFGPEASE